jgi:translation initiation factor 3 subunit I
MIPCPSLNAASVLWPWRRLHGRVRRFYIHKDIRMSSSGIAAIFRPLEYCCRALTLFYAMPPTCSYTHEGDFVITCGKDSNVNLWWSDNGERAGTFNGHNGAVWTTDTNYDSSVLLTGAGDSTARLWDMSNGEELFKFGFHEPCRAVRFNLGCSMAAISTDPFMNSVSAIRLVKIADDVTEQTDEVVTSFTGPRGRISRILWADLNRTLITSSEDGCIRRWDVETGKVLQEVQLHKEYIGDVQMSVDGSHFITASVDQTAKILDTQTFEVLKTFTSQVPINSAALSPTNDYVLIGGGQDAAKVTTTSDRAGHFEARFFHKVFGEEIANVSGHFGPINSVAFSPGGTGFTTGGEEGYVRMSEFDADYYTSI